LKKVLLIDSANIFHSKKYSYIQGAETNIIEPFLTEIRDIVFKLHPDMVVLLNDKYKSRYRAELTKDYKAHRVERMQKFTNKQLEGEALVKSLKNNLHLFNGVFVDGNIDNVEADDLIGMLSLDTRLKGFDFIAVTTDKDMSTVLPLNRIYDWKKQRFKTPEDVYGLDRNEYLMFTALVGDSADNFKGLKNCGEKTALKLVQKYKSINNLLQNCYEDSFEEKDSYVKKALQRLCTVAGREELKLGYNLAKIFRNTTNLNDTELKRYEEIVQDILNYKKPQQNSFISEGLDEFLIESKAFDGERIISEIGDFL
jgi:DNA polymerase-1